MRGRGVAVHQPLLVVVGEDDAEQIEDDLADVEVGAQVAFADGQLDRTGHGLFEPRVVADHRVVHRAGFVVELHRRGLHRTAVRQPAAYRPFQPVVEQRAQPRQAARLAEGGDERRFGEALGGQSDRRDLQVLVQAERPRGRGPEPERGRQGPWVSVSGGVEYDSNVLLRGNGVQVPDEISDEGDARAVWTAQVGTELFRNRDWTIGALAAYYGSAHFDLTDFDTHYPSITTWVDRRIGEAWVARLQYDFSYAWVGGDAYLREHSVIPALFHDWGGRRGTTRLFGELTWDDYRFEDDDVPDGFPPGSGGGPDTACPDPSRPCGPFGLDESRARNRDGFWWIVGFDHVVPVAELRSELSLGYRYHQYDAEGREYDFQAHEVEVGTRTLLPWRLVLDLQGRFTWRPYDHPSTYPAPRDLVTGVEYGLRNRDKRENVWQASAILERPVTDWLIASLRYEYTRNDANVDVFDFDRHVVGGYLTVFYQPSF